MLCVLVHRESEIPVLRQMLEASLPALSQLHVLLFTLENSDKYLHEKSQEALGSLINSKSIARLTLCPIWLPKHFSKGKLHKHVRGDAFSRVFERMTADCLSKAIS